MYMSTGGRRGAISRGHGDTGDVKQALQQYMEARQFEHK